MAHDATNVNPARPPERSVGELPAYRDAFPFASASLALGMLALIGASLGLFAATLGLPHAELVGFHDKNHLDDDPRNKLFFTLLAGGALAGGAAALWLWRRGREGVPALQRASQLLLPLGFAGFLPSLFAYDPWHNDPLTYMIELAIVVLLFEQALRVSLAAMPEGLGELWAERVQLSPRVARMLPLGLVMLGSLGYAWYFSYYTILHHHRLQSSGFDLGINVNWCWNALHGHPERSTVLFGKDGGHFLGNHAIFGMALWLPFYALKPGAETLLIFQATMAGLAAIPLYLFACTQIPRFSAVVVAFAYLMFAPLHGPNFYDFHELIPPLFFHFLLYWAIAREK
ncbi:MAG TPA: DUF2079 domain-containing protein, partial [Polyangiales bacterium]|nr:DUF2079 domain-containing protein [Polyangiales bacterium]